MARIEFDSERKVWLLDTSRTSYVVHLTASGQLINLHWGAKLRLPDAAHLAELDIRQREGSRDPSVDTNREYALEGGKHFGPPALSVRFGDGTRGIEAEYVEHAIRSEGNRSTLEIRLQDLHYPLGITLVYRIHEDGDVIERWVVLRHTAEPEPSVAPILVRNVGSASWTIPFLNDYRLSRLHGRWGAETQLDRVSLAPSSTFRIGSRTGTTSHEANPWFAIDDGTALEEYGDVFSGALAFSGAWEIAAHRFANGRAEVTGGFGHEDFDVWKLHPGQELLTPVFAGLYASDGFGGASRQWHSYLLRHILPRADETRPVLYNSWEATTFDINEENQKQLARRAADLGVELFVMDDGWFGGRVNDRAGLGDWWPNPDRFPNGLGPLADYVHGLGMQFGIWVEPEMVNPDSDLYRAHPDWVYHYPHRTRTKSRNQLVLNFARSDVREWAYEWLHDLLLRNEIDYVKWDMNRPFTEPGWPDETDHPERLWVDHVRNLYDILDRLRQAHPKVAFETCSGGGGRADFGIFARTDMAWTSDNTDGWDRLEIQHGFSQVYAPRVMSCWVTDSPDLLNGRRSSLAWRFHVAMGGLLGIGGNLLEWSDEELAEARDLVAAYKRVRPVIQHGSLYRLLPPAPGGRSALQYVARDGSEFVLFAYLHSDRFRTTRSPIRPRGLDPAGRYRNEQTDEVLSGALLQGHGVNVPLQGDFDSAMLHYVRED